MVISTVTVDQSRWKKPVTMAKRPGVEGACNGEAEPVASPENGPGILGGQDQGCRYVGGRRGQPDRGDQPGVTEDTGTGGRGEAEEGDRRTAVPMPA
nr:hypothetical protein StreXyl84_00870 [Streptomyces sp. Xyl84]